MEFLDTKGLAERWGLKPSTLENWRNLSKGPSYRKIGARVRYYMPEIEAFEEKAKRNSTDGNHTDGAAMNLEASQ
jgi:predicted DNA-binding transcriptional regulator AlpA